MTRVVSPVLDFKAAPQLGQKLTASAVSWPHSGHLNMGAFLLNDSVAKPGTPEQSFLDYSPAMAA